MADEKTPGFFDRHVEPRALDVDERLIMMRTVLVHTKTHGCAPRFMEDPESQRALRGEVLDTSGLRFYVDRMAMLDHREMAIAKERKQFEDARRLREVQSRRDDRLEKLEAKVKAAKKADKAAKTRKMKSKKK